MRFSVSEPTPDEVRFFESEPTWPCVHGHEECSFRPGGPCSSLPCTCETEGHCLSCRGEG